MGRFSGHAHAGLLLLAALSSGRKSGYAIAAYLTERGVSMIETELYPALHDLEARGLVTSEWTEHDGRRRRMYRLTDEGRSALDEARRSWTEYSGAVDGIVGGVQWATTP